MGDDGRRGYRRYRSDGHRAALVGSRRGGLRFPDAALLAIQFPVMGYLENKRIQGWLATGSSGVNETFPFDPMGMGNKDANMKLKEIKNGRAAMISFVGIVVQAIVYREGPVAALKDHVANPFGCNMATNIMNLPVNLA